MAHPPPAVVSDIPANLEENCRRRIYFEVGNVYACAKIAALVSSQRIDYSAWLKNYDWQVIARKTASVYHSLANKERLNRSEQRPVVHLVP